MFHLDITTLLLMTMLFSMILFIILNTFALSNKRFKGIKTFAFSNLSLFAGSLLSGLNNSLPRFLSVAAADFFIFLAFYLFLTGSYRFLRKQNKYLWFHITSFILVILAMVFFTFFKINENYRMMIFNLYLFIESSFIVVLYIKQSLFGFKSQKLSAAYGFILFAAYCLFAIVWNFYENRIPGLINTGLLISLFYLLIQVLTINLAFSILRIVNSILNDDLENQAKLDPLTKVLNRRAFTDELQRELARSRRQSLTFSLILADIDHFKQINDNYGHLAGDSVIISFTKLIVSNLRINDLLSRVSGEQFMIILPDTSKKYAAETADRIRAVVEHSNHPFNGKNINYTVSLGVSSFDIDAQNQEELLECVEIALSKAKTNGRNRVEIK